MSTPSKKVFDQHAGDYDSARRRLVPCFDAFYGAALDAIDDWRERESFRVLELGAGTGLFSALLLERFKGIELSLMDASDAMLEQAKRRLSGETRASFAIAEMETAELGGPWDAIVSALAIHHLSHDDKRALFRRVGKALGPGGLFLNAEQVAGANPFTDERNARIWRKQIRALGASEPEIEKANERMAFDRCASVENHIVWLKEAGLADADCIFKSWRFAVLTARQASGAASAGAASAGVACGYETETTTPSWNVRSPRSS